jgi:hypothetical protein
MRADEQEFTRIRSQALADLQRASRGIASIARILHNSLGDDIGNDCNSGIDDFSKQNLAGAVECMSDFMYQIIEDECLTLAQIETMKQGAAHG